MKTFQSDKTRLLAVVLLLLSMSPMLKAQQIDDAYSSKHIVQLNALEFKGRIYSVVYLYQFSPKNHLVLGLAYQNIHYNCGTAHAPTIITGYRRYFWKGLNAEFALWTAFNKFYENTEQKYYNTYEIWGEFRTGYDFNFKIGNAKLFVLPQLVVGRPIAGWNKPQSIIDYTKNDEPLFVAGNIALGFKF
jgi:hypothetical protein